MVNPRELAAESDSEWGPGYRNDPEAEVVDQYAERVSWFHQRCRHLIGLCRKRQKADFWLAAATRLEALVAEACALGAALNTPLDVDQITGPRLNCLDDVDDAACRLSWWAEDVATRLDARHVPEALEPPEEFPPPTAWPRLVATDHLATRDEKGSGGLRFQPDRPVPWLLWFIDQCHAELDRIESVDPCEAPTPDEFDVWLYGERPASQAFDDYWALDRLNGLGLMAIAARQASPTRLPVPALGDEIGSYEDIRREILRHINWAAQSIDGLASGNTAAKPHDTDEAKNPVSGGRPKEDIAGRWAEAQQLFLEQGDWAAATKAYNLRHNTKYSASTVSGWGRYLRSRGSQSTPQDGDDQRTAAKNLIHAANNHE